MTKQKHKTQAGFGPVIVIVVACCLILVSIAGWTAFRANRSTPASTTAHSERAPNTIVNAQAGTSDLVSFLEAEYTGCEKPPSSVPSGQFEIIQQVGDYAKLGYGCTDTIATAIVKKDQGSWTMPSPTGQFTPNRVPSCKFVEQHQVPKELAPVCAIDPVLPDADAANNLRPVK